MSAPGPSPILTRWTATGTARCSRHHRRLRCDQDGLTYEGPYEPGLDLNEFTIGPGVAPSVSLYALKVFGCSGSTDLTDLAIEWAMDPNDDGDFSDHVDVINMSLGSPYGSVEDSSAVAANNAVKPA